MKILMTTEKVDKEDSIFAFSHLWIKTIAENPNVEKLTVIGLSVGKYDLPNNVKVLSLGKEKYKNNIFKKIIYLFNFYKYIWAERKNYDLVFVHMNQQNVILGALIWKLLGKKVGLWYTHRAVTKSLKLAVKLADVVFTAADESMNVMTNKKKVLGHGILTSSFVNTSRKKVFDLENNQNKIIINSIGRITSIKNLETLIKAVNILQNDTSNQSKNLFFEVHLIGPEINEADKKYKDKLNDLIIKLNLEKNIIFVGGKNPKDTKEELWQADIHVNLCPTGGLDKAVIESACSDVHSFVCNNAFSKHYGELELDYLFEYENEKSLANKIQTMINLPKEISEKKLKDLQNKMIENFDVKNLIENMLKYLNDTSK